MKKKSILIAEDDDMSYRVLDGFLRKLGYPVHRTLNGWDTFVYCMQHNIHLLLLDMKMPIMDGFQSATLIKKHKPEIIIMAQTALTMNGDEELCRIAGCDGYISKPIDYCRFIEMVKYYMSLQSADVI